MKFRLDPFPKVTQLLLDSLLNARILVFSIVMAKIMLDRLYRYAVIINPLSYDAEGEAMLDIIEYHHPCHNSDEIFYALNSYGPKGRAAYLTYLYYDVAFVIARTVPLIVICSWGYRKVPEHLRPGVWLPILNMAIDLFESFLMFGLLKAFPHRNKTAEWLTAWVIEAKWYSFHATLALSFFSLVVAIYFGFHGLLKDSVVIDKEREGKLKAREQVQDVLTRSAARRQTAADSAGSKSKAGKKNA